MHYHGTPITPRSVLQTLAGRNFCVSFAAPGDLAECHRIGQSVMLDNGAFSVWKRGEVIDWSAWRSWAEEWLDYPTTWAVLPDVIAGGERDNDRLLQQYMSVGLKTGQGAPVWHLHEPVERLLRLADGYSRICFGSSGEYRIVGSDAWHRRVSQAFTELSARHQRLPWIHMLRGMSLTGSDYPFASVDSTDIARNHNRPQNIAKEMAERWDAIQNPARWKPVDQLEMEVA